MLFLGTEKFPEEKDYNTFLSTHGGILFRNGYSNAYTSGDQTNYHFKVNADFLEGALDIFSQFFISPLFTQDSTDREMKAIDSEHSKNLQSDSWRCLQLMRHTSNPLHPYHKFGTGSIETLKKHENIRELLLQYYDKYYSANIMNLVLVGKNSLDELQKWAQLHFLPIKNKNVVLPTYPVPPLTKEYLGKITKIVPAVELRQISFCFPLPEQVTSYKSKPTHIVSHFIGHEGPGSLHAALKKKGWIVELVSSLSTSQVDFAFFTVAMVLTPSGLNAVNEICTALFQYISLLKNEKDLEKYFDERKKLASLNFEFKEKELPLEYAVSLASNMHYYPPSEIISGQYLVDEWSNEKVKFVLDHLLPDNLRITIASQSFEGETTEVEPYYKINYSLTPISDSLLEELRKPAVHPDLFLPQLNPFIPTDFNRREPITSQIHEKPKAVVDPGRYMMWYKYDTTFNTPKAYQIIDFVLPNAIKSAEAVIYTTLYCKLLEDSLNEYTYDADVAGLSYNVKSSPQGMRLLIKGYNCKQFVLVKTILEKMSQKNIFQEERFAIFREETERQLNNVKQTNPYTRAIYEADMILECESWSYSLQLEAIKKVDFNSFITFANDSLYEYLFIEYFGMGNLTCDDGKETIEKIFEIFPNSKRINQDIEISMDCLSLQEGSKTISRIKAGTESETNSAIEVLFKIGDENAELSSLLSLFVQCTSASCFDKLRTTEQLGYIVHSGMKASYETLYYRVLIQSDKFTPTVLFSRVEAWIASLEKELEELSEEKIDHTKSALVAKRLEKDKTLTQQINKYFLETTFPHAFRFNRDVEEAEAIAKLTKLELVQFFNNFIHINGSKRTLLVSEVYAGNLPFEENEGSGFTQVNEIKEYQNSQRALGNIKKQRFLITRDTLSSSLLL